MVKSGTALSSSWLGRFWRHALVVPRGPRSAATAAIDHSPLLQMGLIHWALMSPVTLEVCAQQRTRSQTNTWELGESRGWCHLQHSNRPVIGPLLSPHPLWANSFFYYFKAEEKTFISLHARVFLDGLWKVDSGCRGSSLAGEVSRPLLFLIKAWPGTANTFLLSDFSFLFWHLKHLLSLSK